MKDRQHVWHDPSYPPNPVITEDRMTTLPRAAKPSRGVRRAFFWIIGILVVGALLTVGLAFGAAIIAGVWEGVTEPVMPAAITTDEEEGVRGLAATIADRGKRGDFAAIAELGDGSKHLDSRELEQDTEEAFGGLAIKDWSIDYENVQVLIDQETEERIVVFRLVLVGPEDETHATNPFYATERDGRWRLTGIRGRDLVEDVY